MDPAVEHGLLWSSSDFQTRKRSAALYLRGLDSLAAAKRATETLIAEWENPNDEIKSALHTAAVINYARPFGKGGGLPSKIKRSEGFDKELHDHILAIRDKLVAHADTKFLQAHVLHTVIDLKLDGVDIPIPLNTSAHVKALHLLTDISLANRYNIHIGAALDFVHEKIKEVLTEIQTAALANPESALHTPPDSERINAIISKDNKIVSGMPYFLSLTERNEAMHIPPPQLTVGGDGYVYRQIEMAVVVHGDVLIHTASGVSTLTIGADPSENAQNLA